MHVSAFTPHQCSFVHIQVPAGSYLSTCECSCTKNKFNCQFFWQPDYGVLQVPDSRVSVEDPS